MVLFGISVSNFEQFYGTLESDFQQCFQALQRQNVCLVRREGRWR